MLRALCEVTERPRPVSIGSAITAYKPEFRDAFDELEELWTLGYRRFKYIDQRQLPRIKLAPCQGSVEEATSMALSMGIRAASSAGRLPADG